MWSGYSDWLSVTKRNKRVQDATKNTFFKKQAWFLKMHLFWQIFIQFSQHEDAKTSIRLLKKKHRFILPDPPGSGCPEPPSL
jgi:hypothetical protein